MKDKADGKRTKNKNARLAMHALTTIITTTTYGHTAVRRKQRIRHTNSASLKRAISVWPVLEREKKPPNSKTGPKPLCVQPNLQYTGIPHVMHDQRTSYLPVQLLDEPVKYGGHFYTGL